MQPQDRLKTRRQFTAAPGTSNDSGPLVVVVRVTTNCALACRYCGFSREKSFPRREIDARQLLAFGQALNEYRMTTSRSVLVSWLGGEPYQWSQLWRVSEQFQQDFGLSLGITSNGTALISQRVRQQTLLRFAELTLSVDGLDSDHDAVRQTPHGYARLRQNCMLLREEDRHGKLWIRANMVLMRSNIAHFGDACRQLVDWGVNEVTFNQLGGNDRPEFYPHNRLLPEQLTSFCAELPKPLLRYRTGDYASLLRRDGRTYLTELEGRAPVLFPLTSGRLIHCMEVTRLMRLHPLLQYRLHQDAEGRFFFSYRGLTDISSLSHQLNELLEHPETLILNELPESAAASQKVHEYRTEKECAGLRYMF